MILASEKSTKEIQQSEPAPQFTVGVPRVNPLAANSILSLTKGVGGVDLDSIGEFKDQEAVDNETLLSRMIDRSRREVERRPDSARSHTNLGIALLNAGQVEAARIEFETALRTSPKHYIASTSLARIEVEVGNFDRAEQIYTEIQAHYPKNATPLVSLAQIAMKRHDWLGAERLFKKAIQMGHRAVTARYNLAMVCLKLGKGREAISLLRSVARDEVRAPFIYEGLGAAYALGGDLRRAAVAFKSALSLSPSSQNAVRGLAKVLLDLGSTEEATELLVDHLEKLPNDHEARQLLAKAYGRRKQFRSAAAQLIHAFTELDAGENTSLGLKARLANNIGAFFLNEGDVKQAWIWLTRSLAIAPDYEPIPYQNLARIYIQRHEFNQALATLEQCRKRFRDNQTTALLTAGTLVRQGFYDEAIRQFEPFIASGNAAPELYADLGRIFIDVKGDYISALRVLKEGYEKFSNDPAVVNNLAYTYLMSGEAQAARPILESFQPVQDPDQDARRSVALTATWGLLHIVEGELELGRRFYKEAERVAAAEGDKELARTVLQKMFLELARANVKTGEYAAARKYVQQGISIHQASDFYERDLRSIHRQLGGLVHPFDLPN